MTPEERKKFNLLFQDHLTQNSCKPFLVEKIQLIDPEPVNQEEKLKKESCTQDIPFSYEPIDPDEKARNIIEILRLNYTDIELSDALIRLRDILIADLREQGDEIYHSLKEIELAIQKLS